MNKYVMTKSCWLLLLGLFVPVFAGCDRPNQGSIQAKPLTAAPEVTSESEEGFYDLVFFIAEQKAQADGAQVFRASGTHKGRALGFEVVVGSTWKGGSPGKDIPLVIHSGQIRYRSIGPESDAFVAVLDELYGTKLAPKSMRAEAVFTALSLEGNPGDLKQGPAKIKCFFESGKADDYAELFTNLD